MNRIESEFYDLFAALSRMPGQGHTRKDLTKQPVLFFPLYSFLVVYQPIKKPLVQNRPEDVPAARPFCWPSSARDDDRLFASPGCASMHAYFAPRRRSKEVLWAGHAWSELVCRRSSRY